MAIAVITNSTIAVVASAVAFVNGVPDKTLYRHYKIRSTTTQDDFKSMYEVVSRRTRRGLEEGNLPNLMVIDGGKGQLSSARAAPEDHGVDWVDLISLFQWHVPGRLVARPRTSFQAHPLTHPPFVGKVRANR